MSGFIEGENRYQSTLFPERVDDYVDEDSAARVIDVFVDRLDISGLGFKTVAADTGRPGYDPRTMLKIFIYGYMNKVHSSRRLEIESKRNVELMWLTGRLAPDFKTIADFRKDNGEAIRLVCREFVVLCRKLDLFSKAFVAIDGAKFKAVNTRDKNFTKAKLKRRLQQIDESIERYLNQIASADRHDTETAANKSERLKDKISALEKEMDRLKKLEVRLLAEPDQQISLTDPDARSMATSGRGTGMVGYNVQAAVDTENHLIVAHDVTQDGHDRNQLHRMATKAKDAMAVDQLEVVADRGYFKGEEILACDEDSITTFLPRPLTSTSTKKGLFNKRDFIYHAENDTYRCPAGKDLTRRTETHPDDLVVYRYWSSECGTCQLKSKCTTGKERRVSRWEHEEVVDALDARLEREPERMRVRRSTAEHPFGTLKCWMGYTHFLTKTIPKVSTEMSLHVLAYNMKRVMNILGPQKLIEAMQS